MSVGSPEAMSIQLRALGVVIGFAVDGPSVLLAEDSLSVFCFLQDAEPHGSSSAAQDNFCSGSILQRSLSWSRPLPCRGSFSGMNWPPIVRSLALSLKP